MGAIIAWPAPAPADGADPGGRDQAGGRCRRMLTRAASQSIPVPVRFGCEGAPEHQSLLRFGPMEPDGSVRDAILWDPLLERFV